MDNREYNIVSRISELEKKVSELEKQLKAKNDICPKCQSIISDKDGICWICYINSNK